MRPLTTRGKILANRDVVIQRLFFGLGMLFLLGLFFSRSLLGVVPALMLVVALADGRIKSKLLRLRHNRSALCLLALYGWLAVSFLYTEDRANWLTQMHRSSPLVLLPLSVGLGPPWSEKQVHAWLLLFVLLTTGTAVGTVFHYLTDIEAQNQRITYSQNTEPINGMFHLHFGVLATLAIFLGGSIWQSGIRLLPKIEKYAVPASIFFLTLTIHLLAYRTALLAFYLTSAVLLIRFIAYRKRYLLGMGLVALLVGTPGAAYFLLKSWQLRVDNTRYDVNRYFTQQDINEYSVAQRLAAWETALAVVGRSGGLGVGPADIELEMQRQYARRSFGLKVENRIMIHNQYLHALVGCGWGGLWLLLYTLLSPLGRLAGAKDFRATAFIITMGAALVVDSFLELQHGLNAFVFFYTLLIIRKEQNILMNKALPKAKIGRLAGLAEGDTTGGRNF